jgi:hypothetical protein
LAEVLGRDSKILLRPAELFDRRSMRERSGKGVDRPVGRGRRLESVEWLLLALFVALEIIDILTTNRGLESHGTWEANPLMAAFQVRLGALWWLPKAAMVAWVALAATRTRRRWPLYFAATYCAIVVVINLIAR